MTISAVAPAVVPAMTGEQKRLAAGLFAVAWGTNVSTPLILRYQDRLDLSNSGAVAIFTVYVLGILLALLFAGRLSDRLGRRPLVLPCTALSALGSLIMLAGRDSLALLFTGRFVLGAVSGATLSVGTAWINELRTSGATVAAVASSDPAVDARATTAARLRLATITTVILYVGFGLGPITSALYERVGPSPLVVPYVVHALACVAAAVAMFRVPETKRADPTVSLRPRLGIPPASRPEFVRVLAPASLWVFGFPSVSFALFPVILRDAVGEGNDVLVAGANGTLTAVVVLLARPIIRVIDDARRAIPVALAMGATGYVLGTTAFATGWWWLAPFAAIALGSASGVLMSSGLAITEEIADESNRGSLSSTFYLAAYSGMSMPLVITGLSNLSSTTVALAVVTCLSIAAAVFVLVGVRHGDRVPATA